MANVWAVKNGNTSDNTLYNTGAPPTAADTFYSNGKTITVDSPLSFALWSNNANAGLGIVSGGTATLAINSILSGNLDKIGNFNLLQTGGFNLTWTGDINVSGGTASAAIAITGLTGTSVVNINLTNFTSAGSNNGIISTSTTNCTANINLSAFTMPATLFSATPNANLSVYFNGTHSQTSFGYCTGVGLLTKFYLNGLVTANTAVLLSGTTGSNYVTVDSLDLSAMGVGGVFPITGAWKFNRNVSNFFRANFTDGVTRNLSLVADYPPISKIEKGCVFDFGSQQGIAEHAPDGSVALGVKNWTSVGTMNLTVDTTALVAAIDDLQEKINEITTEGLINAEKFLTAIWESDLPAAVKYRVLSTYESDFATIQTAING